MQSFINNHGKAKATCAMQKKEMEMLKQLSHILNDNGIEFFLAYGTALGCARHQGFIPWDDDMDIYIWGSDYEKIKDVFARQDTGNLQFHDYSTIEGYPHTFLKIVAKDTLLIEDSLKHLDYQCGVYIDVFLLFPVSNHLLVRKMQEAIRYFRYCLIKAYYFEFENVAKKILHSFAKRFVSPNLVQKKLLAMETKKSSNETIVSVAGDFGPKALFKRSYFDKAVFMPFENFMLPMPAGYKEYLEACYGDYMTLPNENERVSNHSIARLELPDMEESDMEMK